MTVQATEQTIIPFSKLIPTFKHFVANNNTRPALQYVFNDGQFTEAIDSHIAIRVDNALISDTLEASRLFNPKTESYVNPMHYPDLTRLFPFASDKQSLLNKKNLTDIIAALRKVKKVFRSRYNGYVELTFSDNTLTLYVRFEKVDEKGDLLSISEIKNPTGEYTQSLEIDWLSTQGEFAVYVNVDLMIKVLLAMKRYLIESKDGYVVLNAYKPLRPILFSSKDEKFQTLLCPIRTY